MVHTGASIQVKNLLLSSGTGKTFQPRSNRLDLISGYRDLLTSTLNRQEMPPGSTAQSYNLAHIDYIAPMHTHELPPVELVHELIQCCIRNERTLAMHFSALIRQEKAAISPQRANQKDMRHIHNPANTTINKMADAPPAAAKPKKKVQRRVIAEDSDSD